MLTVITQNPSSWHKITQAYHKSTKSGLEGIHACALTSTKLLLPRIDHTFTHMIACFHDSHSLHLIQKAI